MGVQGVTPRWMIAANILVVALVVSVFSVIWSVGGSREDAQATPATAGPSTGCEAVFGMVVKAMDADDAGLAATMAQVYLACERHGGMKPGTEGR